MKYTYWQDHFDGYKEVGSVEEYMDGTDFDSFVRHYFATEAAVGDRVATDAGEVWERNAFGTWDSIASGPAGHGLIGAMEGP